MIFTAPYPPHRISDSNSFYSLSDTSTDHELDALMDERIDEIMDKDSVAKSLIFWQPTPTILNGDSIPINSPTLEALTSDTTKNVCCEGAVAGGGGVKMIPIVYYMLESKWTAGHLEVAVRKIWIRVDFKIIQNIIVW